MADSPLKKVAPHITKTNRSVRSPLTQSPVVATQYQDFNKVPSSSGKDRKTRPNTTPARFTNQGAPRQLVMTRTTVIRPSTTSASSVELKRATGSPPGGTNSMTPLNDDIELNPPEWRLPEDEEVVEEEDSFGEMSSSPVRNKGGLDVNSNIPSISPKNAFDDNDGGSMCQYATVRGEPSPRSSGGERSPGGSNDFPESPKPPTRSSGGALAVPTTSFGDQGGGSSSSSGGRLSPSQPAPPAVSSPPIQPSKSKIRTGSKTLIGKGSFGCVFKGLHEETNQIIAVKEILLSGDSVKKQIDLISREIKLMRKLDHPNIVRYLGAERDRHQLLIYLEYVTGGSMAALVKEYGPLTEDMAKRYTKQVLHGLKYLHDNNIAHRDIKGDNLLVGTDGTVKLADFGTSKELRTLAATVTGTACFMSPEVIKGTGHGLESDIWSLGCAVIEMLTGKPPFSNFQNQYAIMMHIANCSPEGEIPTYVSKEAQDMLRRCLQVEPSNRATAEELIHSEWIQSAQEVNASSTNGTPSLQGVVPDPPNFTQPQPAPAVSPSSQGSSCQELPPPACNTDTVDSFNPMRSYSDGI